MTPSPVLTAYSAYRDLTVSQRLSIYNTVKAANPTVKSLNKLFNLCFDYFLKNIYNK